MKRTMEKFVVALVVFAMIISIGLNNSQTFADTDPLKPGPTGSLDQEGGVKIEKSAVSLGDDI